MKRTLLVLVALTAGGLAAQEKKPEAKVKYPPLPLHVFASKLVKKKWTPPLPEGLTLLDFNGRDVLATVKAKNAVYVETDYLRILSTVPPQKITPETWPRIRETLEILAPVIPQFKKKYPILKGVALAHFFAVHMHRMMVDAWKILGSDLDTYARYLRDYKHGPYMRQKNKFEIYLFGKRNHYLAFSDRFTGRRYTDGLRHRAPVSDVLAFLLPPPPSGPRDLNGWVAVIIHNWAHNVLMSEIKNSYVIPTWLDVGFAHWFERREGEHNTYCFDETGDPVAPLRPPPRGAGACRGSGASPPAPRRPGRSRPAGCTSRRGGPLGRSAAPGLEAAPRGPRGRSCEAWPS